MTELSINALVGVWRRISESDFGDWITYPARKYYRFFSSIFKTGDPECRHMDITEEIAPMLRGFQVSNHVYQEDFSLNVCLDISHVAMSDYILEDFHHWLLSTRPYPSCEYNYLWFLQTLAREGK